VHACCGHGDVDWLLAGLIVVLHAAPAGSATIAAAASASGSGLLLTAAAGCLPPTV